MMSLLAVAGAIACHGLVSWWRSNVPLRVLALLAASSALAIAADSVLHGWVACASLAVGSAGLLSSAWLRHAWPPARRAAR